MTLEAECEELRDHAADTIGRVVGSHRTLRAFERETGVDPRTVKPFLTGDKNVRLNGLCKIAYKGGYRVRLVLERIEEEG